MKKWLNKYNDEKLEKDNNELFQLGGSLPGSQGFMYARTGAPSNGKYAKKTKPSAQKGIGISKSDATKVNSPNKVKIGYPQKQDRLYVSEPNSKVEQYINKLANPVQTFGMLANGQPLSNKLINHNNPFDAAISIYNPFSWIESAKATKQDLLNENYTSAAFNALGMVPDLNILKEGVTGAKMLNNKFSPVYKNSINYDNYLTQSEAVQARAERMLSQEKKWRGQNNNDLRNKFENAVNNHNPAGDYPAEKYGVNQGNSTMVSKDIPVNEANKSRIAAHETGHYYRNVGEEADEWNSFFNFDNKGLKNKTKVYLKGKPNAEYSNLKNKKVINVSPSNSLSLDDFKFEKTGTPHGNELRERAAQLKDYIAQKNNIPLNEDFIITKDQLNDAIKNYVKDTKLDNTMTPFLQGITNKKGLLEMMNKSALGVIPLSLGAASQLSKQKKEHEFQKGGELNKNKNLPKLNLQGIDTNAKVDNTFVKTYPGAIYATPKPTDKEIAADRKRKINESIKYNNVPLTSENWREVLAKRSQSTGDKLRTSLEPNVFDDYLNPASMIGQMASNLGQAPLEAKESDSYLPYITSVAEPLIVGALGGIGAKTTGQFVNNVINPLAGTEEIIYNTTKKGLSPIYKSARNKTDRESLHQLLNYKGIKQIKALHKNLSESLSNPEAKRRLKEHLGITELKDSELPKLDFRRRLGSSYSKYDNTINIDFDQLKEMYKLGYDISPKVTYEHEIGHWLQAQAHKQTQAYKDELAEYLKELENYNKLTNDPNYKGRLYKPFKPKVDLMQTKIDDMAKGVYKNNKISEYGNPNNPNILKNPNAVIDELYFREESEAFPHIREMRQNMLDKGYLKDKYQPITEDIVAKFISENPKDRISGFTKPSQIKALTSVLNEAPSVALPLGVGIGAYSTMKENKPSKEMKSGGIIKDDKGQWNHPGEITEISGNDITMKGVPYPVIGVSDEGDVQMMYPEQDYKFEGNKVTEYPLMQDGGIINSIIDTGKNAFNYVTNLFGNQPPKQVVPKKTIPKNTSDKTKADVYNKLQSLYYGYMDNTHEWNHDKDAPYDLDENKIMLSSGKMENGGELIKLNQLSNFTNYNKKQSGGWLDNY